MYDAAGRLETVTWTHGSDVQSVDYVYDDGGRLESRTDTGFGTEIDGVTTYGYDDFGHLDAITGPGLDLTFDLDRAGRRLASTQDGVVTTFTNDGNGRIATVANGWAGTTTYTYNADGTLTEAALPDGQWRRWNVDETTGRVERFDQYVDGQRTITDLGYHDDGQLASETTGGLTTEYTYDQAGQLTHIDNGDVGTLDDEVFAYDALGRRSTHTQGATVTTYAYDPDTGELATATTPGKDTVTYLYDDAGRLTSRSDGTSTVDYTYDPRGRLATVDHDTPAGEWTETHQHDGDGLLAELTVTDPNTGPDTTQRYTWDPTAGIAQIAAIDTGTGYTHLAYGPDGRIAAQLADDTTVHFATDHQGSTTATPTTADLAAAARYDAWGQPRSHTNTALTATFGYRGELTTSDLTYLRNRYYQPETGTFTTRDPLDGVDGTTTAANPWHYVANDAVNVTDCTGLRADDCAFNSNGHRCQAEIQAALTQREFTEACPRGLEVAAETLGYGGYVRAVNHAVRGDWDQALQDAVGTGLSGGVQSIVWRLIKNSPRRAVSAAGRLAVPIALAATAVDGLCVIALEPVPVIDPFIDAGPPRETPNPGYTGYPGYVNEAGVPYAQ